MGLMLLGAGVVRFFEGTHARLSESRGAAAAAVQFRWHPRSLQGQTAVAVQWGVWSGAGMAASEGGLIRRLARRGYGALAPAAGLAALGGALASAAAGGAAAAVIMAAPFLWPKFLQGERS